MVLNSQLIDCVFQVFTRLFSEGVNYGVDLNRST